MTRTIALAATASLALAACSDSTEVTDPTDSEQIAAAAESMVKPQAGRYEVQSELLELDLPGLPPEQKEMMQGIMEAGFSQTTSYCLTEEEAEQGWEDAIQEMQQDEQDCEYSKFEVSGDSLDAAMSCTQEDGSKAQMTMSGDLSETGQDITMAMSGSSPDMPGGEMNMKIRMRSNRTGACEG